MTPLGSYKCKNTLRKAVIKTKKAMPESPRKKEAVILELVKDVLPTLSPHLCQEVKKRRTDIVSDENVKTMKSFFERDDISRAAPGRKDAISVKDIITGKRTHVIKRHMVMSVAEAYCLFKEEYPTLKVGKSKFYEFRPTHVRPTSEMPHNVCVCVYHANFDYMVEGLHKNIPDFPSTSRELVSEITCDVTSEKCMTGECQNCFDIYDIVKLKLDESRRVSWKQWMKQDNQQLITTVPGTLKELLTEMQKQIAKFKHHVFVKNQQAKHFETKKNETSSTEIVLQVDFAENFAILSQDEIQSAHWSHPQVTLFTGWSWGNKAEEKHSYIIVSNELSHDKCAVWVFLWKIIQGLKIHYPSLKKVLIFSDGCAAQFKNRFTLSNICHSQSDWGVDVEWSFFASSHGKGAVDGVGATAKRMLWSAIMSRKAIIHNSWECFDYLKSKGINGMHIFFIAIADIDIHRENLQSRWEVAQPIPFLQRHHHFQSLRCNSITYGVTSNSTKKKLLLIQRGKLNYNDVYTSSESDMDIDQEAPIQEDLNQYQIESPTQRSLIDCTGQRPKPGTTNYIAESSTLKPGGDVETQIGIGTYVLVRFESNNKKATKKEFKYVAVCQEPVEDSEVKVMFMKAAKAEDTDTFVMNENGISHINISQILKILKEPSVKTCGNRIYYHFEE